MRTGFGLIAAFAAVLLVAQASQSPAIAQNSAMPSATFELYIDEVYNKRRGGEIETSVAFRDPLTRELNPTLRVGEGERVTIRIVNRTQRPRAFAIMGAADATSPTVPAGAAATVQFQAPARGNYIYHDPGQASLAETRSLFGDFMVDPRPRR